MTAWTSGRAWSVRAARRTARRRLAMRSPGSAPVGQGGGVQVDSGVGGQQLPGPFGGFAAGGVVVERGGDAVPGGAGQGAEAAAWCAVRLVPQAATRDAAGRPGRGGRATTARTSTGPSTRTGAAAGGDAVGLLAEPVEGLSFVVDGGVGGVEVLGHVGWPGCRARPVNATGSPCGSWMGNMMRSRKRSIRPAGAGAAWPGRRRQLVGGVAEPGEVVDEVGPAGRGVAEVPGLVDAGCQGGRGGRARPRPRRVQVAAGRRRRRAGGGGRSRRASRCAATSRAGSTPSGCRAAARSWCRPVGAGPGGDGLGGLGGGALELGGVRAGRTRAGAGSWRPGCRWRAAGRCPCRGPGSGRVRGCVGVGWRFASEARPDPSRVSDPTGTSCSPTRRERSSASLASSMPAPMSFDGGGATTARPCPVRPRRRRLAGRTAGW